MCGSLRGWKGVNADLRLPGAENDKIEDGKTLRGELWGEWAVGKEEEDGVDPDEELLISTTISDWVFLLRNGCRSSTGAGDRLKLVCRRLTLVRGSREILREPREGEQLRESELVAPTLSSHN